MDLCWIESDLYGPSTVKQIIDGNHVKRGPTAHIVTHHIASLIYSLSKAFVSTLNNHSVLKIDELAENLGIACTDGKKTEVSEACEQMVDDLRSLVITNKMEIFEEENSKNAELPVFKC